MLAELSAWELIVEEAFDTSEAAPRSVSPIVDTASGDLRPIFGQSEEEIHDKWTQVLKIWPQPKKKHGDTETRRSEETPTVAPLPPCAPCLRGNPKP